MRRSRLNFILIDGNDRMAELPDMVNENTERMINILESLMTECSDLRKRLEDIQTGETA